MPDALRGGYLLKSIAADLLNCVAAVTLPIAALREADMCEITCRDQIGPSRNTANKWHAAQPPADAWFTSSDSFLCREPRVDRLPAAHHRLIGCFPHKHQLRGLLSLDMTLELSCFVFTAGGGVGVGHSHSGRGKIDHQIGFYRFSQRAHTERQNNETQPSVMYESFF